MKLKKFITILSVATMTAGLAVGCGSSDSASSDDKSSKSESDWDSSNDITSFPEKMVQEQEEHSSNFSGLKKRKTVKKLI